MSHSHGKSVLPDTNVKTCIFPSTPDGNVNSIVFDECTVHILQNLPFHTKGIEATLSGIWAMVLWRFADVDTAIFGVVRDNRTGSGREDQIVVVQVDPAKPVSSLLDVGGLDSGDTSITQGLSYNSGICISCESGKISPVFSQSFDIGLIARPGVETGLSLAYSPSILSEKQARHLVSGISHAITSIALNPVILVGEVEFCCPTQKRRLLSWQACAPVRPQTRFLFQHIDRNAEGWGDALAVDSWDGGFTYSELNRVSTHIATHLQTLGVGCHTPVLVCFERSKWAIAAMLAVNKSGGAFVPWDPTHPEERLRAVLKRTRVSTALVSPQTARILSPLGIRLITVGADTLPQLSSFSDGAFTAPSNSDSPAYYLFTSGSTGEPKGCEMSHVSLASLSAQVDMLRLGNGSRSLQFASLAFGVSLIEVWATLIARGTICIPSDDDRLHNLGGYMSRARVNWAFLVPTVLETIDPDTVQDMDLFVGGEGVRHTDIITWSSKVRLYQAYGLTEWAGIFAVSRRITSVRDYGNIGTPVNGRAWVVEPAKSDRLAPLGAVGELVIEGPGLAQGYLSNPEKTKGAFIPRPRWLEASYASDTNWTLNTVYKTGDLVRYYDDGSIQYVRRKGSQVKIRGQRLELTEVEYHIKQSFPEAGKVIALVHEGPGKHQQNLIAFTQQSESQSPQFQSLDLSQSDLKSTSLDSLYRSRTRDLQQRLRSYLPGYMIPELLLPVQHLPVTVTGKADRIALAECVNRIPYDRLYHLTSPPPTESQNQSTTDFERELCEMVQEVLGLALDQFGVGDNFFHLGGNSGAAMKLGTLARKRGMDLSMVDIFSHPVLADMARVAGRHLQEGSDKTSSIGLLPESDMIELKRLAVSQCRVAESQVEEIYPVTALQEGLIALSTQDARRGSVRLACQLSPTVDLERLKRAWETVFQSNDILRTRFIVSPSKGLFQVVIKETSFQWNNDAGAMGPSTDPIDGFGTSIGARLIRAEIRVSGDQEQKPHGFALLMHHALCDRWSVRLLLEQLTKAYHNLPIRRNRFSLFIQYLAGKDAEFKDYWTKQLDDVQAVIFPALPSPGVLSVASETLAFTMHLPRRSVRSYTTATYLKLAWALVLSYNTGTDDIVFGVVANGRSAPVDGLEEMTGPTIATLPFRVKLLRKDTVRNNLAQIQLLSVKSVPFEQAGLQNIQRYSSDAKSACMFQNQLIIHPQSKDPSEPFRQCQYAAATQYGLSTYGLSLTCQLADDNQPWECNVTVDFNPAMISASRVQGLLQHLELVMGELLRSPRQAMQDLPGISSQDLNCIRKWNSERPTVFLECVHDWIQGRVRDNPTAPAVAAWDGGFDYQELSKLSDELALCLLRHGIQPRSYIPLLFEKSKWTTVAILGVMKAGAAFILLDPSYPTQRLQAICRDAGSQLVLCSQSLILDARELSEAAIAIHDDAADIWHAQTADLTLPTVQPEDPVYVVFTSGSSGSPKGAVIEHHAYCAAFRAHSISNNIDSSTRMLQFASYAFDNSVMETLSTLMAGGCVCVPSDGDRHDNLSGFMQQFSVTHVILNPSVTRALQVADHPSLRVMVMAGEVMSQSDRDYWSDKVQLMNEYGVAECCVASISRRVLDSHPKNIGFPLGVAVWVVDHRDHNVLVPIGAPGELLIEGASVGREYLNNPEATRRAFIEPPAWLRELRAEQGFAQDRAIRVYKTGDMVQYTSDGSLLFLGRKDGQAKIRNQRFEVEEVEHHIRSFAGIQDVAAVIAVPSGSRGSCLVAFLLPSSTGDPRPDLDSDDLVVAKTTDFHQLVDAVQAELRAILPDYMVPSLYFPVAKMPETRTGKIDRQRLKREIQNRTMSELEGSTGTVASGRPPSTEAELKLQAIWARVLGISAERISADSNFFHLGGDSITAIQVIADSRAQQLQHSVQDIMRLQTISQIANQALRENVGQELVNQEDSIDTPFELSPIQQLFFEKYPDGANHYVINVCFHVRRSENVSVVDIERASQRLVQRHSMLRARFTKSEDGTWQQHITEYNEQSFGFRIEHVDSSQEMEQTIRQIQQSMDITRGPVFIVTCFVRGTDISIFVAGHHLAMDLVSWHIISSDMQALIRDNQCRLHCSTSLQSWVRQQTEYGLRNLEPPPVSQIPQIDGPSVRAFWGANANSNLVADSVNEVLRVDEQTTTALLTANIVDTQLDELLHAVVLFSFIKTFPNRPVPCIYGEGHGREPWDPSIDLSGTIGWFATIWPVIAMVKAGDSFESVVDSVKLARRQLPRKGWEYFTSMYKNTKNQTCSAHMESAEITFNYGGKFQQAAQPDSLFEMESIAKRSMFSGSGDLKRWAMFEIHAFILDGCLEFLLTFNHGIDREGVLNPWMDSLRGCLRGLASQSS